MKAFRIVHSKWANSLTASGYAARWNSSGFFVIYAAENCSLACLENLVHRNGFGSTNDFSLLTINLPNILVIKQISLIDLPIGWNDSTEKGHMICREIGDQWIRHQESLCLLVPSAIIEGEMNVLINPHHPDFNKVTFSAKDFSFDTRLLV